MAKKSKAKIKERTNKKQTKNKENNNEIVHTCGKRKKSESDKEVEKKICL